MQFGHDLVCHVWLDRWDDRWNICFLCIQMIFGDVLFGGDGLLCVSVTSSLHGCDFSVC